MEIIYRAFDGKEFEDGHECENYETMLKVADNTKGVRFYDITGVQLPDDNLDARIEDSWYIDIPTDAVAKFLNKYAKENMGIILNFPGAGYYYYDDDHEEWYPVENILKTYNETMEIFKKGG